MTLSSYADVFGVELTDSDHEILRGDIVRTGSNLYPHFEVIAVRGETAWLRNVQTGADQLGPTSRLRPLRTDASERRLAAE